MSALKYKYMESLPVVGNKYLPGHVKQQCKITDHIRITFPTLQMKVPQLSKNSNLPQRTQQPNCEIKALMIGKDRTTVRMPQLQMVYNKD